MVCVTMVLKSNVVNIQKFKIPSRSMRFNQESLKFDQYLNMQLALKREGGTDLQIVTVKKRTDL